MFLQDRVSSRPRGGVVRSSIAYLALVGVLASGGLAALPRLESWRYDQVRQEAELGRLERQLGGLSARNAELVRLLADQEARLASQAGHLASQAERLAGNQVVLESLQASLASAQAVDAALYEAFSDDLDGLRSAFQAQAAALERSSRAGDPTAARQQLRREVLEPVFQLSGDDAVGSAVLVHEGEDAAGHHYLALTSYHVVRDILSERMDAGEPEEELVDAFFARGGEETRAHARMVAHDVPTDLALVRIDTERSLGAAARLAPRSRAAEIQEFLPVYTVGCPLGTSAQATHGEITRTDWRLGGQDLWMVSSPAYFGNSGGGVFLADSCELIGVFAKIYTHGSFRPQVVTHMGLAVPLPVVLDWLEAAGYGHVVPAEGDAVVAAH